MDDNEILVELTSVEVGELAEFYKRYNSNAPHIYSHLKTALKWAKISPNQKLIQVYARKGEWRIDGTFISVRNFPVKTLVLYTMDASSTKLFHALSSSKLFDCGNDGIKYFAVESIHIAAVNSAMLAKNLVQIQNTETKLWRLTNRQFLKGVFNIPNDLLLLPLEVADAELINDLWPLKSDGSEITVATLVDMNGGYGMYTKKDHRLVAWIIKTHLGHLGFLYVIDEYRRRGLGVLLIRKLSENIFNDGFEVTANIVTGNKSSEALFSKCGFSCESKFMNFMMYKN